MSEPNEEASTRERIIDVSLALFNTRGLVGSPVTRICQHAGIMPGNLTYYFPKKKDILLEIERRFEQEIISLQSNIFIKTAQSNDVTADDTALLIIEVLRILWKYRFFYTSIMAVQGLDPMIRVKFRHIEQRAQSGTAQLVQRTIDVGKMRAPRYPNSVPIFAENLWYVWWGSIYFQQLRSGDNLPSEHEVIYSCAMHCAAFLEDHVSSELAGDLCEAINRNCFSDGDLV